MPNEWIAPIAGIVGALVGSLGTTLNNYVSLSRQEKRKRREEHLRHIEEIFDSLDKVENSLLYFYTN
jgi:formiminotetrahydrofolate cyclodeaminase